MDQQTRKISRKEMRINFEGKVGAAERFKQKVFSLNFLGKVIWAILRYVLLVGISYIILYPFITKIAASFMSTTDFTDQTVKLISKNPTLDQWVFIIKENKYWQALFNTARISILCGLFQTLICAIIGYGFAKFKFKGRNILFIAVIITLLIPHDTLLLSMFMKFRYFDVLGIIKLFTGGTISLLNTEIPLYILSLTGLAFKNGLYIFIFRQFYKGVPDELEEAAYIDGTGVFETFFRIIMPLSVPMMTTVFMFSFSWQWTDNFYTTLFFTDTAGKMTLMPDLFKNISDEFLTDYSGRVIYENVVKNTAGIMIIAPLIIIYLFCQKYLVQGIERSGIVG